MVAWAVPTELQRWAQPAPRLPQQLDARGESVKRRHAAEIGRGIGEIVGLHRVDEFVDADRVQPRAEHIAHAEAEIARKVLPASACLQVEDRYQAANLERRVGDGGTGVVELIAGAEGPADQARIALTVQEKLRC